MRRRVRARHSIVPLVLTGAVLAGLAPALAKDVDKESITYRPGDGPCPSAPEPAEMAGYCANTFSTNHFNAANVDTLYSYRPGFQWYGVNHFGYYVGSDNQILLNSDGSASERATQGGNMGFTTIGSIPKAPFFVGTAFGGGMYVEMTAAYDQAKVKKAEGWPALWTLSFEHILNNGSDMWPTPAAPSSNYHQWAEFDIVEHMDDGASNQYYATTHHWYGEGNKSCPGQLWCNIQAVTVIPIAETTTAHKYGMLWVPATATQRGFVKWYLDGKQQGQTLSWARQDPTAYPPPPTPDAPWTYGVIDLNHMALVFGGGMNAPITVYDVEVWQANGRHNVHN